MPYQTGMDRVFGEITANLGTARRHTRFGDTVRSVTTRHFGTGVVHWAPVRATNRSVPAASWSGWADRREPDRVELSG